MVSTVTSNAYFLILKILLYISLHYLHIMLNIEKLKVLYNIRDTPS